MATKTGVRFLGATLLAVLVSPSPCFAGAWTVHRGHLWAEFFWQRYAATRDFDGDGTPVDKADGGRFTELRNELKLELPSWDNRLNVLVSVPFDFSRYTDRNVVLTNRGLEEATISAKWQLADAKAPLVVAVQTGVNFALGCDVADQPPLGDCQTDIETRVVVSRGLRTDAAGLVSAYATGEVGYRFRRAAPTDEVPYFVEGAARLGSSQLWVKGFVDGVQSRTGNTLVLREDYAKWSSSVMFGRDPTTRDAEGRRPGVIPLIEAGVGGVFAGRNTGAGKIVFVKVAFQR